MEERAVKAKKEDKKVDTSNKKKFAAFIFSGEWNYINKFI